MNSITSVQRESKISCAGLFSSRIYTRLDRFTNTLIEEAHMFCTCAFSTLLEKGSDDTLAKKKAKV